jgi:hypothetical protein
MSNNPPPRPACPKLPKGTTTIRGRSFAGEGKVPDVEYSIDGQPWRSAELLPPNIEYAGSSTEALSLPITKFESEPRMKADGLSQTLFLGTTTDIYIVL